MKIKKEKQEIINEDENYSLTMTGMEFGDLMHNLERVRIHDTRTCDGDDLFNLLKEKGFTMGYTEKELEE